MADKTVLQENPAGPLDGSEPVRIVQGGSSCRTTVGAIAALAFPIRSGPLVDDANVKIAWTTSEADTDTVFPQFFDMRLRGIDSTVDTSPNPIIFRMDAWVDQGGYGTLWTTAFDIYPVTDPCAGGVPPTNLVVHIPHLVVDDLTGVEYVAEIDTGSGLSVTSPSGTVHLNMECPKLISYSTTAISTSATSVKSTDRFYVPNFVASKKFRVTIQGVYTTSAANVTTTFVVKFGGFDSSTDPTIATLTVQGDVGSSIPFQAVLDIYCFLDDSTSTVTSEKSVMNINNQGSTGIAKQSWTASAVSSYAIDITDGGFLNVFAQTDNSAASFVPTLTTFEDTV